MASKYQAQNLEEFKNSVLFAEIHNEERHSKLAELIEKANILVRYYKSEPYDSDSSAVLYSRIARQIYYYKMLILLCADLKKKQYKLEWCV